ncbi:ribonuclease HI [Rhodobacterales bacterium 52_120_T64]|nr:ribonuclease HI [Rhodobacterales bacterium 52_120_T64]
MPDLTIYTDGACSGNPGPGGWGALLIAKNGETTLKERTLCGGEAETTNNRMELTAAIEALNALQRPSTVTLITDSAYVKGGITSWMHGWKKNGWKTSARKPVKNVDLWLQLDEAQTRHSISWEWIKGHAGDWGNERADELARQGMAPFKNGRK